MKKICCRCKVEYDYSLFYKESRNLDGLNSWCKNCHKEYRKSHFETHKDSYKVYSKKWIDNGGREWKKSYKKVWDSENIDKVIRNGRRYYNKHKKCILEKEKSFYNRHRERIIKRVDSYRRNHLEQVRNSLYKRRSLEKSSGNISLKEIRDLFKFYNYTCLCCGKSAPDIVLTLDHVIPLKLGGPNIIDNAQPLCKSCNSRKHIKIIDYRKDWKNKCIELGR